MVAMGGGADLPVREVSKEKELLVCTLTWPEERLKKPIDELKKDLDNIEVRYFQSRFEDGKAYPVDVPEGMYCPISASCCEVIRACGWLLRKADPLVVLSSMTICKNIHAHAFLLNRCPQTRLLHGNPLLATIFSVIAPKRQSHPVLLRRNQPCRQSSDPYRLQDSNLLGQRRSRTPDCGMGRHDGSRAQPQLRGSVGTAEKERVEDGNWNAGERPGRQASWNIRLRQYRTTR